METKLSQLFSGSHRHVWHPRLLLQGSVQALEQQVGGAVQLLRHGLAGADVDEMVMQDPDLLFLPGADVERGA